MGSATGSLKVAARRVGCSVEEYETRRGEGQKWCTTCKAWHPIEAFDVDRSRGDGRTASCRSSRYRYTPVDPENRRRPGPPPSPARPGDKKQARHRVNYLVDTGTLPNPNDLPCTDCGHVGGDGLRHEYDHHLGYDAEHHLDVEAVCSACHHERERRRGR